jgi:hypothetical protein
LKRKRFQAHAAVALGAFFSMSLGTLVSGFLKKQLGQDWFKLHVAFQTIGSLLVIAALAIALREARGETSVAFEWGRADSDVTKRAHGAVGVALVVCVVAQVALGFFREVKGTYIRGRAKQKRTRADGHEERGGSIRDADVERETYERSYGQSSVPPLRKAHVSLGWLLVLGGFANAIVGAVLFERLVYRDTVDVAVDGATKTRSAFWYVAWTLFGVVAALFCLRVFSSRKRLGAAP